jgi:hypothetical protein
LRKFDIYWKYFYYCRNGNGTMVCCKLVFHGMLQVGFFSSERSTSIALNQWVIVIHGIYATCIFWGGKFSSFDNPKKSSATYTKESHEKMHQSWADFEELIFLKLPYLCNRLF